ncbi:MAG: hypothetical protein D6748_02580 [Calditrichaeota bacterium]|nr:MAG: hypothetical protein D6748_02580 [Calditrichota bacterium]
MENERDLHKDFFMKSRPINQRTKLLIVTFFLVISIIAVTATSLYIAIPREKILILFAIYAIPSHFLISFFPIEPAVLYCSKYYRPIIVVSTALGGCSIASILDYLLLVPLLNHHRIRSRFEDKELYQKAIHYFKKWPFGVLTLANMLPVPFYPFKFLSFTSNYPFIRYEASLLLGRFPRYFLLAALGFALNLPNWVILSLVFLFMSPMLFKKIHSWWQSRKAPALSNTGKESNVYDQPEYPPEA